MTWIRALGLTILAVVSANGCGQVGSQSSAPGSSVLTSSPFLDQYPGISSVTKASELPYLPVVMKPLPVGTAVSMTAKDVFTIIFNDPFVATYYTSPKLVQAASVEVGYAYELDATGQENSKELPPYVAFVVTGGASTCIPTGQVGDTVVQLPCRSQLIVDSRNQQVGRYAEIMSQP